MDEGKTAKNRVHLDVAWQVDDVRGSAIVMRDPEGNEFCVV